MATRNKNTNIFREKSIEHFSSPENLDKYIKTTTPGLWLLLSSIIVLLLGILAFAIFGHIDSASTIGCQVNSGELVSYISEKDFEKVKDNSYIEINDKAYAISEIKGPSVANKESDEFLCNAAGIEEGDWYYMVICKVDLANGKYKGKAVYEKISPISFIIN